MNKIKKVISWVVLVAVIIWWTYLIFSNPDLTQTQLALTFWREFLVGAVVVIGTVVWVETIPGLTNE